MEVKRLFKTVENTNALTDMVKFKVKIRKREMGKDRYVYSRY